MATLKNTTISDTGFQKLPVGTTAQRPANPAAGMIRFNTDEGFVEWYDDVGDDWLPVSKFPAVAATGGTVTDIEQDGELFRVHTFTSSGTFDVTRGGDVEYLVVAGGGSGGDSRGFSSTGAGGGGAGGLIQSELFVNPSSYSVDVGGGGSAPTSAGDGNNGNDSSVFGINSVGGGGGGGDGDRTGKDGGSGGGGTASNPPGSGIPGQGNDGGAPEALGTGGGGGGADSAGQDGVSSGTGGSGKAIDISGSSVTYAVGGDGGPPSSDFVGSSGAANRGNGGGGSGHSSGSRAGSGGSGIVIVRYRIG